MCCCCTLEIDRRRQKKYIACSWMRPSQRAGVGTKVRRIVQVIFAADSGVVRLRYPDGTMTLSEPFDIARGVLQRDIFSPVAFIAGLDRIFRMHDLQKPGATVGVGESTTIMSKFEYADDAALIDEDAATATAE